MALSNRIKSKFLKWFGVDLDYYSRIENFTMDVLNICSEISSCNPENELMTEYLQLTIDYIRNGEISDKQKYKLLLDYADRPDLLTKLLLRKIISIQTKR